MRELKEYGLSYFPFQVVPTNQTVGIWVDRRSEYEKLQGFFDMSTDTPTEIILLWGYFGTGKSHALRHFRTKLQKEKRAYLVYSDLTRCTPTSFADLVSNFFSNTDPNVLTETVRAIGIKEDDRESLRKMREVTQCNDVDVLRALSSLATEAAADDVLKWLAGENCDKRAIGVSRLIRDDSQALSAQVAVIKLLQTAYGFTGWLLDEYQTMFMFLQNRRGKAALAIQKGLVNLYNSCPTGLVLALSFTSRQRDAVYEMIPEALRQRIASIDETFESSTVVFPVMTVETAKEYASELVQKFWTQKFSGKFFPFTEEAVEHIIKNHVMENKKDLVPRWINVALANVLRAAQKVDLPPPITVDAVDQLVKRT